MASVEKTTYGETYVVQEDGTKVIPESKRPDGSVRKPIKVKGSYTPSAETRYDPPGKPAGGAAAYPPGYTPDEASTSLGDPNRRIPGFTPDDEFTETKKKTRSRNKKGGGDKAEKDAEAKAEAPAKAEAAPKAEAATETVKADVSPEQATEKLVRKAKKKLTEIEALEKRGAPYTSEEQEKLSKKPEFVAELKYLDKVLKGQAVAAPVLAKAKATPKATPAPQAAKSPKTAAAAKPAPAAAKSPKTAAAPAPAAPAKPAAPAPPAATPQDVEAAQKRLRNVNKKLKEIETLVSSGKQLTADQQQKVDRKTELEIEFKHLSAAVA